MEEYIVYVRTDENGVIIAINSSAFVDGEGWTEIDRGTGDRYHHAQGHYLAGGLVDEDGIYNYKLVDGVVSSRRESEKAADRAFADLPAPESVMARLDDLEAAFDALMSGEVADE